MSGLLPAGGNDTFGKLSDFFDSSTWTVLRDASILLVAVFWLGIAFWVHKDATRRIESRPLVWLSTLLGLFPPFLGAFVYMLFRPPEYLEDIREREFEIKAMERRLGVARCPVCHADVDSSYLVCPVCTTRLRQACVTCSSPLEASWQVCPHCETPIDGAAPVELPTRRRAPRK